MAWGTRRLGPPSGRNVQSEGQFTKCPSCNEMLFVKELERLLNVCKLCGHHFYIDARRRVQITLDEGSDEEIFADIESCDPLEFRAAKTYRQRLEECQAKTGLKEAALCVRGRLFGAPLIACVTDSAFLMGSMGSVVGEKIARSAEMATNEGLPLVIFSGSGGGARMDEGPLSLMQMAKTSAAVARHNEAGLLFVSFITNPTLGGVAASFASLGDIIMAEPGAVVGFTGRPVIKQTMLVELPADFQSAEFMRDHGQIDMIVPRKDIRETLGKTIAILTGKKMETGKAG